MLVNLNYQKLNTALQGEARKAKPKTLYYLQPSTELDVSSVEFGKSLFGFQPPSSGGPDIPMMVLLDKSDQKYLLEFQVTGGIRAIGNWSKYPTRSLLTPLSLQAAYIASGLDFLFRKGPGKGLDFVDTRIDGIFAYPTFGDLQDFGVLTSMLLTSHPNTVYSTSIYVEGEVHAMIDYLALASSGD